MRAHSATMVCVSSSISLVFSLTMIVFYVSFKNLRKGSRGYLVMINVCDFACSLSFLLSSLDVPVFQCPLARLIEGFVIQFFYTASYCWCCCYAIHLYNLVLHHSEIPTRHWRNQLLGWLFPTLSCVFLLVLQCLDYDAIGDCNRVWPWISNNLPKAYFFQLGLFYIPILLILLTNTILYICISRKSKGEDLHCFILLRSFAYLLVAVFCVVWSAWDRTFLFLRKKEWPFPFDVVSLSVPLLGCLNVCVYSLNRFFFTAFKQDRFDQTVDGNRELLEESVPLTVTVNVNSSFPVWLLTPNPETHIVYSFFLHR
ncbi:hypothetical protein WA577_000683 [Blastocystis sp. JDR]